MVTLLAVSYWLLAICLTSVFPGILKQVQDDSVNGQQPAASSDLAPDAKAVYRYPFTVYRLSHLVTNKFLTHGSRSTDNGQRMSGRPMPSITPEASS